MVQDSAQRRPQQRQGKGGLSALLTISPSHWWKANLPRLAPLDEASLSASHNVDHATKPPRHSELRKVRLLRQCYLALYFMLHHAENSSETIAILAYRLVGLKVNKIQTDQVPSLRLLYDSSTTRVLILRVSYCSEAE